jgi:hypothetical protein
MIWRNASANRTGNLGYSPPSCQKPLGDSRSRATPVILLRPDTSTAIDVVTGRAQLNRTTIAESDWLTVDGGSGRIYLGQLETVESRPEKELAEIATWRSQAGESHRKDATPPLPASAGG